METQSEFNRIIYNPSIDWIPLPMPMSRGDLVEKLKMRKSKKPTIRRRGVIETARNLKLEKEAEK